jgi:ABC-2 type transport system ATP-binding protein
LKKNSYKKVLLTIENKEDYEGFSVEGATNYVKRNGDLEFIFRGDLNLLIDKIHEKSIRNLDISEPDLEEIFLHYYSGGE